MHQRQMFSTRGEGFQQRLGSQISVEVLELDLITIRISLFSFIGFLFIISFCVLLD